MPSPARPGPAAAPAAGPRRSRRALARSVARALLSLLRPRRLRRVVGGVLAAVLVLDERTRRRAVSAVLTWVLQFLSIALSGARCVAVPLRVVVGYVSRDGALPEASAELVVAPSTPLPASPRRGSPAFLGSPPSGASTGTKRKRVQLRLKLTHDASSYASGAAPASPMRACVAFSSCQWALFYHIGAARELELAFGGPGALRRSGFSFSGTGLGAFLAAAAACGVPLERVEHTLRKLLSFAAQRTFGAAGAMGALAAQLCRLLPADAHELCGGRVIVEVLSLADVRPKTQFLTDFPSRDALLEALLAAAFVPVYHESPRRVAGAIAVDGALGGGFPVAPWLLRRTLLVDWSQGCAPEGVRIGVAPPSARHPYAARVNWRPGPADADVLLADGAEDAVRWLHAVAAAAVRDSAAAEAGLADGMDPWEVFDARNWLDVLDIRTGAVVSAETYWPTW